MIYTVEVTRISGHIVDAPTPETARAIALDAAECGHSAYDLAAQADVVSTSDSKEKSV